MRGGAFRNAAQAEARRTQILDAATTCFRRDGFRGASMMDISRLAGLSTGHIYHYFESKEAIVEAVVDRSGPETVPSGAFNVSSVADLVGALLAFLGGADEHPAEVQPVLMLEVFAEASRNPLVARVFKKCERSLEVRLRALLTAGQGTGLIEPGRDIERLVSSLKIVLGGMLVQMVAMPGACSRELRGTLEFLVGQVLSTES